MLPALFGIAGGLSLLGQGLAHAGAKRAAEEERDAQVQAALENARRLRARIGGEYAQAADRAGAVRREIGQVESAQMLAAGGSGLDPRQTGLAALMDDRLFAEQDVATIRANAMRSAMGLETEASDLERQAEALRRRKVGPSTAGTLLQMAGSAAGMAYQGARDFGPVRGAR